MNVPEEKPVKPAVKSLLSISRIPLLLLFFGLSNYALLRLLAPTVDPADFSNIIGLAAALETMAIEIIRRMWQRKQKANQNEN